MNLGALQASVDIETFDTGTNAVVVQIGLVKFTLIDGVIDTARINVQAAAQVEKGRSIGADTVLWWLRQGDRARTSLQFPPPEHPCKAVCDVSTFLSGVDYVWARGPQFDLAILNSLSKQVVPGGLELIDWWKWRDERPLRDFLRLADRVPKRTENEVEHDALGDALYQTKVVLAALRMADTFRAESAAKTA